MNQKREVQRDWDWYLNRIKIAGNTPNFYCSIPYLKASKFTMRLIHGYVYVLDDGIHVFPPIPNQSVYKPRKGSPEPILLQPPFIWSTFIESVVPEGYRKELLDMQYIFNQHSFLHMWGGEWAVFRKNCRKWSLRSGHTLHLDIVNGLTRASRRILGEWLESKEDEVQDAEVMVEYLTNPTEGTTIGILRDEHGTEWGILAWDDNWEYINFRYCIVAVGQPYLTEAAKLMFYLQDIIQFDPRLVNDGGVVDSAGLRDFKDRMNPTLRQSIYSWRAV
jgi:hypothetical protein